jgi:integral membrane protein (TIGR01906 family)
LEVLGKIIRWLFVLCLPVMLLTASIAVAFNSSWLYRYGFDKYGVSATTGLDESELEKTASGLISYFNSGKEYINITVIKGGEPFTLFNEREAEHLRDVKGLVRLDYLLLGITLIYILGYASARIFWRKEKRALSLAIVYGSGLTLFLILALGVAALMDFNRFFLQFHLLSFANDLWMLDPSTDYLIMLFPQGFWFDATIFCALITLIAALALGTAGVFYLHKSKTLAEDG